jgi:hypothetical protein
MSSIWRLGTVAIEVKKISPARLHRLVQFTAFGNPKAIHDLRLLFL